MDDKEKKNNVKSGKEVLDSFFQNILSIQNIDKKLASVLARLYKVGEFTERKVINVIQEIREKPEIQLQIDSEESQKKTERESDINPSSAGMPGLTLKKPVKIKNLCISGMRGIKESINIDLNEKSILLYGDNGSGKSSIADSLEWLYKDEVSHLSSGEIDLKEALRNLYILVNLIFLRYLLDIIIPLMLKRNYILIKRTN
ncbi:MAG: AAA family ATPase [Endomicrobium sp.]|jgi:AAA15 family ATPase/GTPase|nr:AAA family ATPase [Endomicrobium sp.]